MGWEYYYYYLLIAYHVESRNERSALTRRSLTAKDQVVQRERKGESNDRWSSVSLNENQNVCFDRYKGVVSSRLSWNWGQTDNTRY